MSLSETRRPSKEKIRPDWISKTAIGLVLGFALALALVGLFAWFGPGGIEARDKYQFNMWLVAPIWLSVVSLVYLFHSAARALLWLGGANLLAWALLLLLR
ncbi:hypothetical protein L9G15_09120 [Shewanella sp. A3A]|uniref:Uncharacterized protein n=1 Tax=Shewanella electrica TaxID=515560 RepID=A0ABT2FQ65_9GAMM|nr:hypothetical protein [Shewanella electrica]MCH1919591.1 hypothetical protein [Shewanella ferrihydritica]MCH1925771.1 hypothetical protein [Shewanella electrica]MCS4557344.1 hypothetical protein [Shewanella electrica]